MRVSRSAVCAFLGVLVLLLALFATTGTALATTFSEPVDADYGHIDNSVHLSQADFPNGAPAAVLAGSESYTDALTATVLAKAANGPLLLTSSTSLSASVQTELVRLKVAKVYIAGLSTTLVNAVKAALPSLTADKFVVLTGSDAYQTAALVAGKVKELAGGTPARVFIVPGDVYGSSLAAAAVAAANGWPVLLTPQAGPFPSASAQAIAALGATKGVRVDTSVNPGISGFAVENTIMGTTSTTDDPGARYSEALTMAEYAVQQGWATYAHLALGEEQGGSVAYSANFPDNVLLASHIAREGGAYLLAKSTGLLSTVADLLSGRGKDIGSIDFMRPDYDQVSSGAWSFAAIRQVKSLNSPRVTGLSKTSGSLAGGGALTVSGTGFANATTVRIGKTDLPNGSWHVNSDASITIDSLPPATQQGATEILVYNYWHMNPSSPSDVYFYVPEAGPELPGMQEVREAVKYLGVPYVWAGASPSGGFDCSGFTMYVYNKFTSQTGVTLPHKAAYQATYGTPVAEADLLPGDLVFFYNPIGHVGMYVGNGLMINSPQSGDLVTIADAFRDSYTTARRLLSPYIRVQQDNPNPPLAYTGSWTKSSTSSASGGSFHYINTTGSVTIPFNGTYLALICKKSTVYGIAKITLDGATTYTVDLYDASQGSTGIYLQNVWNTGTLPYGYHTVKLEWTGTKRAAATDTNVNIDAVDVIGAVTTLVTSPTVTSLSPTSGPTSGGTQVTITGINLTGATAVTFGGTPATSITSNTATQIVATAPPGTGTVDVKVTTPVGTSAVVTGDKYTYADLPAAPTALGASALSTSSIRVTWTDNATNELGFFIMEWTGSSWNVLGSVGPNTTTYTVTGLSPNTIHVYIVGSYNSAGENWPAEICYAATNGTAPAKATGLTADVLSSTSIKLTWTDNSANEWGFLLLRWNGTDFENLGTVGANTTTYTDTGLTPDHQYAYFVAAVNNTGGVWSDPVWVTATVPPTPAPAIAGLSLKNGPTTGGTQVTITGTNLGSATAVSFGGSPAAAITSNTATQIVAVTPAHAGGSVSVQVTTAGGPSADTGADDFAFTTRVEAPAVADTGWVYSPGVSSSAWANFSSPSASGLAYMRSQNSTSYVTITFTGTYLAWIALTGTTTGNALVSVDGGPTTPINLAHSPALYQQNVWNTGTLPNTNHTVKITWAASSGQFIDVDAVEITGSMGGAVVGVSLPTDAAAGPASGDVAGAPR